MSKLGLGTAQFGLPYGISNQSGQTSPEEVSKILSLAREFGVDTLDTAIGYGDSEQVLGDCGVKIFNVVTKLSALQNDVDDVERWVNEQIGDSCTRLKIDNLYAVLLHHPADLLGDKGAVLSRSLRQLKEAGVVQKIGVSIYDPDELPHIMPISNVDLVQAPLNVVDRRLQMSGWLHRLKDAGIEIHTRSAFLQGLLLMNRKDLPEKFERWSTLWDQWQRQLKTTGISALSACLSYPLSLPEVDRVIVGVASVQQLADIFNSADSTDGLLDTLAMASSDAQLINPSQWSAL